MTLHRNAKTCPASRRLLARRVDRDGWSLAAAAEAAGVSERRASEWLRRYRSGDRELADRSSRPRRVAHKTSPERERTILSLRELRMTAAQIAEVLGMAHSTVSAVLHRHGKGRLPRLDADQAPNRFERPRPGELVHIDVKKLGRISGVGHRITGDRRKSKRSRGGGYEFVHVCVDDCTRLAYVEVLPDERSEAVCGFLERAVTWFAKRGVRVERVMTDNGAAIGLMPTRRPAGASGYGTSSPSPTALGPTERQSALSARSSRAGPTERSIARAESGGVPCPPSSTITTTGARTGR